MALGRVGGGWLRAPARDNDGVLLVGTVKQVRQQGPYRVTDLLLPGSDQTVAVYSAAEPGVAYPLDQRLVVFGAIAIWMAVRIFHFGTLSYGKKVSLKSLFASSK